jgi:rubrerythrin
MKPAPDTNGARLGEAPPPFNMDKFIAASRQLDLSGIDLQEAAKYPLSPAEVRTIRFGQDTEFFTVLYMKALMETRALADHEARAFLVMWGYEECSHGRALAKVLEICGHAPSERSLELFTKPRGWLEIVQDFAGRLASAASHDFLATHMTWGAVNELTAIHSYSRLATLTANPILAEVARRIAKDERRHFAFYYQQARRRLASPFARRLAKFALKTLWAPVGGSMASQEDADFPNAYLFDGEAGRACLRDVDQTIQKLPGMEWFDLVETQIGASIARIHDAKIPVVRPTPIALQTTVTA